METMIREQIGISVKNTCVQFLLAYQQQDLGKMLQCCDAQGTVEFKPLGENGKGKIHELGKALWSSLMDSFPNLDNTLDAAISEDDYTVRCQVVIRGTQAKDFAGIQSKGLHFDSDHIFIFRLNEANKINSIEVMWDHADFCRQLGAGC